MSSQPLQRGWSVSGETQTRLGVLAVLTGTPHLAWRDSQRKGALGCVPFKTCGFWTRPPSSGKWFAEYGPGVWDTPRAGLSPAPCSLAESHWSAGGLRGRGELRGVQTQPELGRSSPSGRDGQHWVTASQLFLPVQGRGRLSSTFFFFPNGINQNLKGGNPVKYYVKWWLIVAPNGLTVPK